MLRVSLLAALLGLVAVLPVLIGCETTQRRRPKPAEIVPVRRASPTRAWRVVQEGQERGSVVLFASDGASELTVYVVRNAWQQDLGWIDGLGRAYRLLPHARDPVWVGTGTIAIGAARILEIEDCELVETSLPDIADEAAGAAAAGE